MGEVRAGRSIDLLVGPQVSGSRRRTNEAIRGFESSRHRFLLAL